MSTTDTTRLAGDRHDDDVTTVANPPTTSTPTAVVPEAVLPAVGGDQTAGRPETNSPRATSRNKVIAGSLAAAVLLVVVIVTAAGGGGSTADDRSDVNDASASEAVASRPSSSTTTGMGTSTTAVTTSTTATPPGGPGSPSWMAFIVQVASRPKDTTSRAEAEAEARSRYGSAGDQLLVLESDAYVPAMRPGYWVIYLGPFAERSEAAAALDRLRTALPEDAHVRHLDQFCPEPPCV